MPAKKAKKDKQFHLPQGIGDWQWLIHQAVVQGWTQYEFESHLVGTKRFQQLFPGLVDKSGHYADGFYGSLSSILVQYQKQVDSYEAIAHDLGGGLKFGKDFYGMAVAGGLSADEFASRVQVIKTVKTNPGLKDEFNAQLKLAGKPPLDDMGWRKFLAKAGSAKFYDIYEAAYLGASGLKVTDLEAKKLGKALGTPGTLTGLSELVNKVLQYRPAIGPELRAAGISDYDLAMLAGGAPDTKGLQSKLQSIVDNRAAMQPAYAGARASQGQGGGLSLQQDEAQSY